MSDGPELGGVHASVRGEAETEEIDAVHVPAGEGPLPLTRSEESVPTTAGGRLQALVTLRSAPAVQAAAVAAGGFVAGAAVVGLARRRSGSPLGRRRASGRHRDRRRSVGGGGELLQIVGSRSLLVDVHLLGAARRG